MLKVGRRQLGVQRTLVGDRNIACLLAHHYCKCVGGLRDSESRAVTQTEAAGYVAVVADREDTPGALQAVVRHDERAVVQRRVLEENVLDEAGVDKGVDHVAALLIALQRYILLYHDKCAGLGLGHVHAGVYDGQHEAAHIALLGVTRVVEEVAQKRPFFVVAQRHKEALYLVLEQDDEHKQTYAHELVENRADEFHLENLRGEHPDNDKGKDSEEYVYGAALLHDLVDVVEQKCGKRYIEYVA